MDWGEAGLFSLAFDFKYSKLSGVGIFDDFLSLRKFGKPESPSGAKNMTFSYHSKGFEFEIENGKVTCIFIVLQNCYPPFKPFKGKLLFEGKTAFAGTRITEEVFTKIFPGVFWRDEDDEETILFYEFSETEWQVEFDKSGQLKAIIICTPPLMSDPEARKSYGVAKKWPPENNISAGNQDLYETS